MALDGDAEDVLAGLRAEGFVKPSIEVDAEALLEYLDPFIDAAAHRHVHASPGPGCAASFPHINDPRRPQFAVGMKLNLPPEYLLIHRVWLGGIGVLCQIEGTVAGRATISAWMPHAKLPQLDV